MHIFRMQSWKNQRAVSENNQVIVFIQAALVGVLLFVRHLPYTL